MEKILLTAQRKICLPGGEKTPYRMMANSSYRAHMQPITGGEGLRKADEGILPKVGDADKFVFVGG